MTEEKITKICRGEDCPCGDDPQPIENFDVNKSSKKPNRLCRICRAKKAEKKVKTDVVKDAMAAVAYNEIVSHADPADEAEPYIPPESSDFISERFDTANVLANQAWKTAMAYLALLEGTSPEFSTPRPKPRDENTYKIEIDFSKHPEVLQDLVEMAARDLRDPDKQALFILRSIYEKGIKISENFSND